LCRGPAVGGIIGTLDRLCGKRRRKRWQYSNAVSVEKPGKDAANPGSVNAVPRTVSKNRNKN
jgi:hypothetical protein